MCTRNESVNEYKHIEKGTVICIKSQISDIYFTQSMQVNVRLCDRFLTKEKNFHRYKNADRLK